MVLHNESSGHGPAVVILHGLMGSCENWRTVRAALSDCFRVSCLDLPNHGRSAHMPAFDLRSMACDVVETLDALAVTRAVVVGHSLGAKVAMQLASDHAGRLNGLATVDMSPRAFQPMHLFILRACQALHLAGAKKRVDLDRALAVSIPQPDTRAFLLKNVVRDATGRFYWRVPLQILIDNYHVVSDAPPLKEPYNGSSLFIAGEHSPFSILDDESLIRRWFPSSRFVTIPHAGHLVHVDQPTAFVSALGIWLASCRPA